MKLVKYIAQGMPIHTDGVKFYYVTGQDEDHNEIYSDGFETLAEAEQSAVNFMESQLF